MAVQSLLNVLTLGVAEFAVVETPLVGQVAEHGLSQLCVVGEKVGECVQESRHGVEKNVRKHVLVTLALRK